MKLAIMQPYFLPYIGYFQLINAVDKFVIYDDVNFIKKGWINRNFINVGKKKHMMTIPLSSSSQNKKINEIFISEEEYFIWLKKLKKTILQAYKKAEFFDRVTKLIYEVLDYPPKYISELNYAIIKVICNELEIQSQLVSSSKIYDNSAKKGQDRIVDICKKENADTYINLFGGRDLYSKQAFANQGVKLFFIKSKEIRYKQLGNGFVDNLSILDVMMFNSKNEINEFLNRYELIT